MIKKGVEMSKEIDVKTIKHTVRIYDDELLTYIDELYNTGNFPSKNAVINKSIEFGIPLLYKELLGKKLKENGALDTNQRKENEEMISKMLREIRLTTDDIFIVLNIIEYLTTTIFNMELSKLTNISITDDQVRAGLLSDLPDNLQKVKNEVVNRHNKKRSN